MKLPRLCFLLHMGLTDILGFLGDDILLDDIVKRKGFSMAMDGGGGGLNKG